MRQELPGPGMAKGHPGGVYVLHVVGALQILLSQKPERATGEREAEFFSGYQNDVVGPYPFGVGSVRSRPES